ncbi:MAG: hypothetical protein ACHQDB_06145 [Steroidobacterales bacterium]
MLLHDVSQTALAAAVLTLGLVILLELRSFTRLRRSVDINLGRVFEQLEMLRAESRTMLEAQAQAAAAVLPAMVPSARIVERPLTAPAPIEPPVTEPTALDFVVAPPINSDAYLSASALAAHGLAPAQIAARCGLPAGEARLLASLASARMRRDQAGEAASEPAGSARSSAG